MANQINPSCTTFIRGSGGWEKNMSRCPETEILTRADCAHNAVAPGKLKICGAVPSAGSVPKSII